MNFLDIEKTSRFSNGWRNIFFVLVLVGGVGMAFFALGQYDPTAPAVAEAPPAEEEQKVAQESQEQQMGDVVEAPPLPPIPTLVGELPAVDTLDAEVIIVKDLATDVVLFSKQAYKEHPIASVTKLMSALVLLERDLDWDAQAVVSGDDVVDTHMYAGDTYTVEELWRAGLIASSNKAILTLADASGWTREQFLARMNERAIELGMTQTYFTEPTGLDDGNVSTAADLILLLRAALGQDKIRETLLLPEHNLFSDARGKKHHMWNTNWMLLRWVPHEFTMNGGKTGFIEASGYNFVSRLTNNQGKTVDVVVLGAPIHESRFTVTNDIATAVFDAYRWPE